jgi:hypothetical protein
MPPTAGVATLGVALDHGWKVRAFCDFGRRYMPGPKPMTFMYEGAARPT